MYIPYLMLRNLAPGAMTAAEQRAADEQLGRIVAVLARRSRRVAAQVRAVTAPAAWAGHQQAALRKAGPRGC